tara:strand:- start:8759 stop:9472 length:714 start_codon:yes stop_codon:yes gene_type:complete
MKIAIMQPYFFPYIGYYQLIHAVDIFVIYDNIKYTKKGWINRNRFILNGKEKLFTVPIKSASNVLNINERYLSDDYEKKMKKTLFQIKNSYSKTVFFNEIYPILEKLFLYDQVDLKKNLFDYIRFSVFFICELLGIDSQIIISSKLDIDHKLKFDRKIIAICNELGASSYINPIGGKNIYNRENFTENKISLKFLEMNKIIYQQFSKIFIPNLSIIDVLMFNGFKKTSAMLKEFKLI